MTSPMKRYWLFAGNSFYADGGFSDYRGSFDTIDEAQAEFVEVEKELYSEGWYHVFDSEMERIVDFVNGSYSGDLKDVLIDVEGAVDE